MTCLHTGALVYLVEYGQSVRCDVHAERSGTGDCRILNLAKGWEECGHNADPGHCTYRCFIGTGYFNKTKGIIVVPSANMPMLP